MAANPKFLDIPAKHCTYCSAELSPKARCTECSTCRANLLYWLKRRPAEVLKRRRDLNLYESRMQAILPGDLDALEGNVKELRAPTNYHPSSQRGKRIARSVSNVVPIARARRKR